MKKKSVLKYFALALPLLTLVSCDSDNLGMDGFAEKMFGNPVSLAIQLGATLILILVAAKFLMKPVRKILKDRQDYIEQQITDAEDSKKEAEFKNQQADERIKGLNLQAKEILDEAKKNADNMKKIASNEIEEEKALQRELLKKQIEQEKEKAKEEIRQEIVDVALDASSTILKREVSKEDNERIIKDFIKEVDADE
jgi:F-type H+-transporting ATPase subunit b